MSDRGPAAPASLVHVHGHGGVTIFIVASPSYKHTGRVGCSALNYSGAWHRRRKPTSVSEEGGPNAWYHQLKSSACPSIHEAIDPKIEESSQEDEKRREKAARTGQKKSRTMGEGQ